MGCSVSIMTAMPEVPGLPGRQQHTTSLHCEKPRPHFGSAPTSVFSENLGAGLLAPARSWGSGLCDDSANLGDEGSHQFFRKYSLQATPALGARQPSPFDRLPDVGYPAEPCGGRIGDRAADNCLGTVATFLPRCGRVRRGPSWSSQTVWGSGMLWGATLGTPCAPRSPRAAGPTSGGNRLFLTSQVAIKLFKMEEGESRALSGSRTSCAVRLHLPSLQKRRRNICAHS